MCRLMGYAARKDITFEKMAGDHFAEFAQLSKHHKDGWGCATDTSLLRETSAAVESVAFNEIVSHKEERASLLHFRLASKGLAVQESNSHPFLKNGISFIHNGAIKPPESIDSLIDPTLVSQMIGTTDSERYFYAILTKMENGGSLLEAAIATVKEIKHNAKYSSLNAMLLTDKQFIAYAEYDNDRIPEGEPADYYELFVKVTEDGVIVASSGWPQDGWVEIPNHSGIAVDRASLAVTPFTL